VNFGQPTSKIVFDDLPHVLRLYLRHSKAADIMERVCQGCESSFIGGAGDMDSHRRLDLCYFQLVLHRDGYCRLAAGQGEV